MTKKLVLHFFLMAAGKGSRFAAKGNKLLTSHAGKKIISYLFANLLAYYQETAVCSHLTALLAQEMAAGENTVLRAKQSPKYSAAVLDLLTLAAEQEKDLASVELLMEQHWHLVCQPAEIPDFISVLQELNPATVLETLAADTQNATYAFANWPHLFIHTHHGSSNRQASVAKALQAYFSSQAAQPTAANWEYILIHDAARVNLTGALIDKLLCTALLNMTAIPYLPLSDSIVQVNFTPQTEKAAPKDNCYLSLNKLERSSLIALQTPQVFAASLLQELYAALPPATENPDFYLAYTDDSSLFYANSKQKELLTFCLGARDNNKLTYAEDIAKL